MLCQITTDISNTAKEVNSSYRKAVQSTCRRTKAKELLTLICPERATLTQPHVYAQRLRFIFYVSCCYYYCCFVYIAAALAKATATADNIPIPANIGVGSRRCLERRLVCHQKRIPKKAESAQRTQYIEQVERNLCTKRVARH